MSEQQWDVMIVGGGSAGLSAALTLTRARRRVLVVDAAQPRNRFTGHLHALLGHDGRSPLELLALGRAEVEQYGGVIVQAQVAALRQEEAGWSATLDDGRIESARAVIVATGMRDDLPAVEGLAELWGRGVAVCPYCDAWEVGDGVIGILATSPGSLFQAQLLRQWSPHVIYFENGTGMPEGEDAEALAARGIEIVSGPVASAHRGEDGRIRLGLAEAGAHDVDAVFTAPRPGPLDDVLTAIGAVRTEGMAGPVVEVDAVGRTSLPGVWAVGNVVDPSLNLAMSIGQAARVAGTLNHELITEDVARAVAEARVSA